jgi:hypothetical protein
LSQIEVFHSGVWQKLNLDEHTEERPISESVILKEVLTDLNFRADTVSGQDIRHLVYASPLFISSAKEPKKNSDNCSKPLPSAMSSG